MTIKSLFSIILKVIGVLFIKEIVVALPPVIDLFLKIGDYDISGMLLSLSISFITVGLISFVIYIIIFKTDWVIEKLKLTKDLPEGIIQLNVHRSTVLTTAVIITGLLLTIQAIPYLVKEIVNWYQYRQTLKSLFGGMQPFSFANMIVYVCRIIIGLLLIGNQRFIIAFIEKSQRRNGV